MSASTSKYTILLRILDSIRSEASGTKWATSYANDSLDTEAIQQARSRAFIHFYLKVMFGIADFAERESYVTDGSHDGGIDGYFIDREMRRIHLLQSKFRNTEKNFEQKEIRPEELLIMDIDRITRGEKTDIDGTPYNGKIQGLVRNISELPDIARYNYQIAIIANCNLPATHLRKLTDGHHAEVFNFDRTYNELVFPTISGTYFRAQDVTIHLDLSNKSAGAKTSYSVETQEYLCEITVLFIPTLEIAKAMDRYRNSILEYNPRSYLDLEGQQVNASIRETLHRPGSNEFALMNNGMTILSDETNINERIGQHNKAQLHLLRPQIINGGQTAYTLSRIYNESKSQAETIFSGKEVLTKIITLTPKDPTKNTQIERLRLIDEISAASNRQTPVINADRVSNDSMYTALQRKLFEKYGLLYERKRGEFSDGVVAGYIARDRILERNLFLRIFLASQGKINAAVKKRIFLQHNLSLQELTDHNALEIFFDGYKLFRHLNPKTSSNAKKYRNVLAKIYIGIKCTNSSESVDSRVLTIEQTWNKFLRAIAQSRGASEKVIDPITGKFRDAFVPERWTRGGDFGKNVEEFISTGRISTRSPGQGVQPATK